jgi:PBSX family phage terminase large subunit
MEREKEIKLSPYYFDNVFRKPYKVIIQVGGRFSGKSYNSEIELACNLAEKSRYKLLVIEDLESGLTKGYYAGLKDKIEQMEQDKAYSMIKSPVEMTNRINGNKVIFSGFATDQQKKAVKAIDQVTEIVVEEGEWVTYDDFVKFMHQLRGGDPSDRKLTILMNPVNPNCFVNEMFIETTPDRVIEYFKGTKRPKVFEKDIVTEFEYEGETLRDVTTVLVVLSTHHDNPFLTIDQRATIEKLRETDPESYLQLGEARFIRPSGTFFKEFTRETHVVDSFVIPKSWTKYRALDYGLDMLACLWFAVSPSGMVYAYKELHEPDLIISEAAKRVIQVNGDDVIRTTYAPPDLMARRQDTGLSAFELFSRNGVALYKSSNNRINGWLSVKEGLKVYETRDEQTGDLIKTAQLKVFSNCDNLIKNIMQIQRDEKEPNDCATEPHDITHICDALRYYAVTRFKGYIEEEEHDDQDDHYRTKTPQDVYGTGRNANQLAKWG